MIIIIVLELFSLVTTYYTTPQPHNNSKAPAYCMTMHQGSYLFVVLCSSYATAYTTPMLLLIHGITMLTGYQPTAQRFTGIQRLFLPTFYQRRTNDIEGSCHFLSLFRNHTLRFLHQPHQGSYLSVVFSSCYATAYTTPMFLLIRGLKMLTGYQPTAQRFAGIQRLFLPSIRLPSPTK